MDIAQTSRPARPLLSRPAAASPWSRGRIAGETVLLLVLAGIAGAAYATESGSAAKGWAVALLVGLLSLVRRSLPATVLVVSSALAGSVLGAGPLLIYASWSAGSRIKRPWRAVGAYAAGLVLYVAGGLLGDGGEEALELSLMLAAALGAGPYLVLAVVPGLASRYRAQRRDLLDALRRHNAQLVREQAMVARQARLLERQRIAQDMHDSLGHQLALIAVHAGALEVDPELRDRQREGWASSGRPPGRRCGSCVRPSASSGTTPRSRPRPLPAPDRRRPGRRPPGARPGWTRWSRRRGARALRWSCAARARSGRSPRPRTTRCTASSRRA